MKSLGLRAAAKGLELLCRIAPDVPAMLVGDAGRLRQVLINLVGNAVKFTDRGEVAVDVRPESRDDDSVAAALRGPRHGHRHPGRQAAADVPALRAGRSVDHAALRRHGPGAGHLAAAGGADGRPLVGRKPRGPRQHVPLHGPPRRAAKSSRRGTRRPRRRSRSAICRCWSSTTTRRTGDLLREMLTNWGMQPVVAEGAAQAIEAMRARPATAGRSAWWSPTPTCPRSTASSWPAASSRIRNCRARSS